MTQRSPYTYNFYFFVTFIFRAAVKEEYNKILETDNYRGTAKVSCTVQPCTVQCGTVQYSPWLCPLQVWDLSGP